MTIGTLPALCVSQKRMNFFFSLICTKKNNLLSALLALVYNAIHIVHVKLLMY